MEIDWNFRAALLFLAQKRFLCSAYTGNNCAPLGGGAKVTSPGL